MAFQVGYGEININPPLGIFVYGYYIDRFAEGFLDDLMASAMAVKCGDKTLLMIAVDNCLIKTAIMDGYRRQIATATGVDENCIFITASHTHTGPQVDDEADAPENIREYTAFLGDRLADVAAMALRDLKDAKMGFIYGWAPERVDDYALKVAIESVKAAQKIAGPFILLPHLVHCPSPPSSNRPKMVR